MHNRKDWQDFGRQQGVTLLTLAIAGCLVVFNRPNIDPWYVFFICLSLFLGSAIAWIFYLFGYAANRGLKQLADGYEKKINDLITVHNNEITNRDIVTHTDNKTMAERIIECQKQNLTLQKTCRAISLRETLSNLILDEGQIAKLESSVPIEKEIIVMTSKFVLEKKSYLTLILDNIRKGIVYKYLIPNNDIGTYGNTVLKWWNEFKKVISSDTEYTKLEKRIEQGELATSDEFTALMKECKTFHKMTTSDANYDSTKTEIQNKFLDYFKEKVKTFEIDKNYSFITVIMYQKDDSDEWDVIIKLPTSRNDNVYTAYLVPDDNIDEKRDLVSNIVQFCGDHLPEEQLHGKKIDIFGNDSFGGKFK